MIVTALAACDERLAVGTLDGQLSIFAARQSSPSRPARPVPVRLPVSW